VRPSERLQKAIELCEPTLIYGDMNIVSLGRYLEATIYSINSSTICVSFLNNIDNKQDATVQFNGTTYNLLAWSVSVLHDCKNMVYNTAQISIQISLLGMKKVSMKLLHLVAVSSRDTGKTSENWSWNEEYVGI
jgi:hypothetical protein